MSARNFAYLFAASLLVHAAGANSADKAAGEALTKRCAECHEPADWKGESAESLEALIKGVVTGQTKHKVKLQLSDAEIADIAAFWSSAAQSK